MAKLYKEDQQYHDTFTIALMLGLGSLMVYKIVAHSFILELGVPASTIGLLSASIIAAVVFYKNLKFKIRISPKKMTFKIDPLPWMRIKVSKDDIEGIEFFQVTEAELCTGWTMNFGQRSRIFNFGDRKGLIIRKTCGKHVVVFSRKLYSQRAEIKTLLEKHNWNIAVSDS